jgi:hypothetical protein
LVKKEKKKEFICLMWPSLGSKKIKELAFGVWIGVLKKIQITRIINLSFGYLIR